MKNEILRFYQALYREDEQCRPKVSFENLNNISQAENIWLERNFEKEEVKTAHQFLCCR